MPGSTSPVRRTGASRLTATRRSATSGGISASAPARAATAATASRSRPATASRAPRSASSSATDRPIPLDAPVTRATEPSSLIAGARQKTASGDSREGGGGMAQQQAVTFYREEDADPDALSGQTVAVVGYGNLGRSMALNLRDSGLTVTVGNVDDDYRATAQADGFEVSGVGEAVATADVVYVLIPD